MQASADGHPDPAELASYADGDASADVRAHVLGCSACTEQSMVYARTQAALRRSLYRFDCPDPQTLGEYQLDLLEAAQHTVIAGHAVECAECRAELEVLRSYLATPTEVQRSLVDRARRVVAALFTPAPGPAYGGLRGTSESATRVFVADDVTVTVAPGQGRGTLIGLIVVAAESPEALAEREVRVVASDGVLVAAKLDDLGNFEFEHLAAGLYALEVDLADTLVVVEEVQVR